MPSPLTAERWKSLEPLIDAAVDLPRERWPAFLDDTCGGDAGLRADLEQLLLQYDRADTLLDHPAAQRFGSLLGVVAVPPPELVNGNYRIERKLGQGGMATVYLAHDMRHDREVAVKVLHPELSAAFRTEQFLAEIRTMAGLSHPHILPLHDSGEAGGLLFFVMPYVEGETLRQRIERETQLAFEDVVRIACEVASALDSAHRHGVIHRDIKPENILLGEGGALVADFGIALAVSTASARDASQPGWIAGTPRYMSPEQMLGEGTIDSRSDVYSLGVVAYEMLAGQPPSPATIIPIMAGNAAMPPPPLRALRGALPSTADAVLAKALARSPEDRYPTAGEFAGALQRSLAVRRSRRSAAPVATAIIVLTVAVVGTTLVRREGAASAAALALTSATPHGPHQTRNLAAYDLYQRGRDQLFSRSDSGMRVAIEYYKQAIAADSTYAAAYAELAHMYALLVGWETAAGVEAVAADAQAAALKAVSLDDSLSDSHAELGFVRMFVQYDMASAGAELQRAIALDPASGRAHDYLQYFYAWSERPAEALAEARRATELDPLSVENSAGLAGALYFAEHYDEALALIAKLYEVRPEVGRLQWMAAHIYMSKGMWPEAIAQLGGKDAEPDGVLGRVLAQAGYRAEARRMLAKLIGRQRRERGWAFQVALVYEGLGDYDNAFAWLAKAIDEHTLEFYIMSPAYDHLRADPRFERIRRRLNRGGAPASAGIPGAHQTRNLGAYDLYTRGREVVLGGTRNEERAIKAFKYFKQAIAVDSTYAAAYAELAYMYALGVSAGVDSLSRLEVIQLAHATALKAVALDSTLTDAWAVLGLVNMFSLYDMPSAKAALDRALALDPSSPRVHGSLFYYYEWIERPAEALAEAQRQSELDPLSVLAGLDLATALYGSGRYDEALAQLDKLRDVDPPLARTGMVAGAIYLSKGMLAEAVRTYQEWDDQNAYTGRALALAGRRAEARRMLAKELAEYTPEGGADGIVSLYEGLGDYDRAFTWLDKAIDDHSLWYPIMWPTYAHLRADPRFERVRQRLNRGGV